MKLYVTDRGLIHYLSAEKLNGITGWDIEKYAKEHGYYCFQDDMGDYNLHLNEDMEIVQLIEIDQKELAIKKLYEELYMIYCNLVIESDLEEGYLTENTYKGRDIYWYLDDCKEGAIYVDTLEMLTPKELEDLA